MNTLGLFLILGGVALLFLFSALLIVFKANLVKLRYQSIDRGKQDQLRIHKRIALLLDNMEAVVRTVSFCQVVVPITIGVLLIPLLSIASRVFGWDVLPRHLVIPFILLFIGVVCSYYFLSIIVTKITGGECSINELKILAGPILLLEKMLFPVIWMIRYIALRVLSIFNVQMKETYSPLDASLLIRGLGRPDVSLSPDLLKIVNNAIRLPELDVSDVLLPRNHIQFLDLNDTVQENLDSAKKSGHTRFPLCKGGLDQCLGIIHIKDVFQYQGDLGTLDLEKFQKQLIRFPETTPLEEALKKLLKFRIHMALVVDEFAGTTGLLTLEDILEELVGNIQDEFDQEDALIIPISKHTYKVSGLAPVHELESFFDISMDNETVSTFGGLITAELGRIPEKNERIKLFGWSIKIVEVSQRRIISAIIRVTPSANS